MNLTVVNAPDVDGPKAVRIAQGESQVPTVLRPRVVAQISAGIPGNLRDLFAIKGQNKKFSILVGKSDALAIGGPFGSVKHGLKTVRQLLRVAGALLIGEVDFVLTIEIGDECDFCSIW